ncbi:MAG: hypothetical protein ACRYFK_04090 [Janthinobacterium lividum]
MDSARHVQLCGPRIFPTANDDSYWIKVYNGAFVTINGIITSTWEWAKLMDANLSVDAHTFTIAYREDGAMPDKILITTYGGAITGKGSATDNCKIQQTINFDTLPTKLLGDANSTLQEGQCGLPKRRPVGPPRAG